MNEKLSLTELQLIIKDSLYLALPDMYWVIAEISEIKENYSGHCYLELIEKHPDETNVRARIKAIIWSKRYSFIASFFKNITGESLREGLKILIKTKVEYHEIYGLSLVIVDIDPTFTIGDLALKRQMVINKLEQEGVFTMNKELDFPAVPQRIAIISSKSAAGYSDFISHLTGNSYGYVFHTALIDTAMQGAETESGVISALDRIALTSDLFDVVVIIRGGGSQSDLSWFDSYNIAYHVTQFPLPVITGIGHDKDMSVTDMVAYRSLKTPTAVADFIIDCVVNVENKIIELSSQIKIISQITIEKNRSNIETYKIKLIPAARTTTSEIRNRLSGIIMEIINIGKRYLVKKSLVPSNQESRLVSIVKTFSSGKEADLERRKQSFITFVLNNLRRNKTKLAELESILNILRPENVLRRGYTITSFKGMILKKREKVKTNDLIDTQFSDGTISSVVVAKTKVPRQNSKIEGKHR